MTLHEFDAYVEMLRKQDWFHNYSDDHRVWATGNAMEKLLFEMAAADSFYKEALAIWKRFVFDTDRGKEAIAARDAALNEIRTELLITA